MLKRHHSTNINSNVNRSCANVNKPLLIECACITQPTDRSID